MSTRINVVNIRSQQCWLLIFSNLKKHAYQQFMHQVEKGSKCHLPVYYMPVFHVHVYLTSKNISRKKGVTSKISIILTYKKQIILID